MEQMYKKSSENTTLLIEFLEFLKFKISNGSLSETEINSIYKCFVENSSIYGTIEDLAKFYNQTPNNVRVVIHRKLIDKPKRKVMYSFNQFSKIKPDSWE